MKNFIQHATPVQSPVLRHKRDGIFIRHNDYFRKFLYNDLLYVKACGCYCDLYFRTQKRITVPQPLGVLSQQLPGDLFVRIHHSYVVSLYDIDLWIGNSIQLAGEWLPIGEHYRQGFLSRLNVLTTPRKTSSPVKAEVSTI